MFVPCYQRVILHLLPRQEGNAKSERQEFPKPRQTAINQPLGDLRITKNFPNLLHPAELLLKHINTEHGGKKGRTNQEEGGFGVQPADVGILPRGFLRPQEQIL